MLGRRKDKPMPKQPERLDTVQGLGLKFLEDEVHKAEFRLETKHGWHNKFTLPEIEQFCHSLRMAGAGDEQLVVITPTNALVADVPLATPRRSEDDDSRG